MYPIKRDTERRANTLFTLSGDKVTAPFLAADIIVCCVGGGTPVVLTANDNELYKFIFCDVCMFNLRPE